MAFQLRRAFETKEQCFIVAPNPYDQAFIDTAEYINYFYEDRDVKLLTRRWSMARYLNMAGILWAVEQLKLTNLIDTRIFEIYITLQNLDNKLNQNNILHAAYKAPTHRFYNQYMSQVQPEGGFELDLGAMDVDGYATPDGLSDYAVARWRFFTIVEDMYALPEHKATARLYLANLDIKGHGLTEPDLDSALERCMSVLRMQKIPEGSVNDALKYIELIEKVRQDADKNIKNKTNNNNKKPKRPRKKKNKTTPKKLSSGSFSEEEQPTKQPEAPAVPELPKEEIINLKMADKKVEDSTLGIWVKLKKIKKDLENAQYSLESSDSFSKLLNSLKDDILALKKNMNDFSGLSDASAFNPELLNYIILAFKITGKNYI